RLLPRTQRRKRGRWDRERRRPNAEPRTQPTRSDRNATANTPTPCSRAEGAGGAAGALTGIGEIEGITPPPGACASPESALSWTFCLRSAISVRKLASSAESSSLGAATVSAGDGAGGASVGATATLPGGEVVSGKT